MLWVLIGSALVALALLVWGFSSLRRKRLVENVPTSKVKGVFAGLNELKGRARKEQPLTSYLAEEPCVYYRYDVSEQWQRVVTTTDHKGRPQTRTESGWKSLDSGEGRPPFFLHDDTGRIRIQPEGAKIEAARIFSETCGPSDPLYYGKGPRRSVANSTQRRRFVEHAIRDGAPVYVMGAARLREDVVEPEIAQSEHAELFLISTRTERKIARGYGWAAFFKLFFGTVAAFLFPAAFRMDGNTFGGALQQQLPVCIMVAGGYLGLICIYYLVQVYNGLVRVRERMEMAESMIDIQLKRRHELIPRLATVVKEYARYEQETLEGVTRQRSAAAAQQGRALRRIFALAEDYPDLKANESFLKLQRELVNTEDKIAHAREFYNGTVKALNQRIESLPDVLVARIGGFSKSELFAAEGFERTAARIARD